MAIGSTALVNFLVILLIGIAAGIVFHRFTRSWFSRLGSSTSSDVTSALVGIAGSFIGFHLGVILGLLPTPLMLYLCAIVGGLAVLWLWRGR
jgi:type III secretory pathway component EscV